MGSLCIERGSVSPLAGGAAQHAVLGGHACAQGRVAGRPPTASGASFLQAAAEAIPQPDETYDVVGALCRSGQPYRACWHVGSPRQCT